MGAEVRHRGLPGEPVWGPTGHCPRPGGAAVCTLLIMGLPAFPARWLQPSRGHDRLDLPVTIRSVHRPFEDQERQELGSPDERLHDSSDPDTGSEEEGGSRLSPPHSPRGETLAETWQRSGVQSGFRPWGFQGSLHPGTQAPRAGQEGPSLPTEV